MRNKMARISPYGALAVVFVVCLTWGTSARGQQSLAKDEKPPRPPAADQKPTPAKPQKPEKSAVPSLQELLTQALKENPDVRVAEIKLHEAEAVLNRTRLQVIRKVVAVHQALKSQQAQVEEAEAKFKLVEGALNRFKGLQNDPRESQRAVLAHQTELDTAKAALVAAKAALAQTEAELPYLLGKYPQASTADPKAEQARLLYFQAISLAQKQFDEWANSEALKGRPPASPTLPTAMAGKIRKALNTPVLLNFDRTPLSDVLFLFGDKTGISFYIKTDDIANQQVRLSSPLKEAIPMAAALQAIGDLLPHVRFTVRDYGILVVDANDLPPGAVLVERFWKAEQAMENVTAPPKSDKPAPGDAPAPRSSPPGEVKGIIQDVDRRSGLVSLSPGSDAGLQVGATLEVYRLKPKPVFLGTVRVVDVTPARAVAKPVTSLPAGSIQPGDQVADRILSRR